MFNVTSTILYYSLNQEFRIKVMSANQSDCILINIFMLLTPFTSQPAKFKSMQPFEHIRKAVALTQAREAVLISLRY